MIEKPIHEMSPTEKAQAAFELAADAVVEKARATGTPVVIWKDGKIVHLTADEAEQHLMEHRRKTGQNLP